MHTLFFLILIGITPGDNTSKEPPILSNYHSDSVHIYQRYADQISYLKSLSSLEIEKDIAKWRYRSHQDSVTTCFYKQDLSAHNGHHYDPIDSFYKDGFGIAYAYPKPSKLASKKISISNNSTAEEFPIEFVAYDAQTHFVPIKDTSGKTHMVPFERRLHFRGSIITGVDTLNPITKETFKPLSHE
jgi:hypothetical protein